MTEHTHEHDFVHLHLHTEYSLLDGFARIDEVVKYAKELGMPALGITDHGTMFGVIDFYKACKSAGIKPIIGVEAYLARRKLTDRDPQQDSKPYHMLLLAENQEGYKNLLRLSSVAQLEGYYYRPRIDRDLMAAHAKGVIATSGCLAAEIPRMVEDGNEAEAKRLLGWYQDVFGKDNFYIELQSHDIEELRRLNKWLIANADYADIPLLATNDVHYVRSEDYEPHDTLLCIQTSAKVSEVNRMRMTDNSYYLRTQKQMWDLFGHVPSALSNSLLIAERCQDLELTKQNYHLPVFPVPKGFDEPGDYLRYLCEGGLRWRFGDDPDPSAWDRLQHELTIINRMGFATYFLIVWDLTQFARRTDIWWNVRGSGAGSLVAYVLGITNLDPLENALLFERFLNPGRVSMPDMDLDFPEDRRMEMIDYCSRKYGSDKVAAIITFGTLGAKAAIRDVARALDVPLSHVDQIVRTIPTSPSLPSLPDLLGDDPEKALPDLKEIYKRDEIAHKVIDLAAKVEGVPRHASTHAAGIIVADKPLVEYIPLHRPTKGDAENSPVKQVTQFPMETAEAIGLLKIDFLGLSTLTILRKACELIELHHGDHLDMSNIPYKPDPSNPQITRMVEETFQMMGEGHTIGVFQVESAGMRQMLTEMKPQTFEHIIAAISLYRPGPMDYIPMFNRRMHGEEEVKYHHPKLIPILSNTYGICVYQEQIMQIGAELFGYSLGEADLMRRAVSKKKEKDLLEHRKIFLERGPERGIDPEAANKIFDDIEFFARYGFNKCVVGSTQIIDAETGQLVAIEALATGQASTTSTYSLDTETLRIERGQISAVLENGIKPVYRLTTQLGHMIEATDNHPFYTPQGWRVLGHLTPDDRLAIPQSGALEASRRLVGLQIEGDIAWDRVVSIEYAGEQPTYDLTIEGYHNFIANGIVVHNSHAADYAVITCQTAFLKRHYPHEYMTALMSVYYDDSDKVSVFIADCRRMGIAVLPPALNASYADFHIEQGRNGTRSIRFGFGAIKNVGLGSVEYLLQEREAGGPFQDLDDFIKRCSLKDVGKRALESLIKVGAFDEFGIDRALLLVNLEAIMTFSSDYHKNAATGQSSIFDMLGGGGNSANNVGSVRSILKTIPPKEMDKREQLRWEKELVGLYLSEHPLQKLVAEMQYTNLYNTAELKADMENLKGKSIRMVGLVAGIRALTTKKGDAMAIVQLEDMQGMIEAVLFPRTWATYRPILEVDKVYLVEGKVDVRGNDVQLLADKVNQNLQVITPNDPMPIFGAPPPAAFDEETGEVLKSTPISSTPSVPEVPERVAFEEAQPKPPLRQDSLEEPPELAEAFAHRHYRDEDAPDDLGYESDEGMVLRPSKPAPHSAPSISRGPDLAVQVASRTEDPVSHWLKSYPEAMPQSERLYCLNVEFERSFDSEKDRRLLRLLMGFATESPGKHYLQLTYQDDRGVQRYMNFGNTICVNITKDLMEKLRGVFGVKRVWVTTMGELSHTQH